MDTYNFHKRAPRKLSCQHDLCSTCLETICSDLDLESGDLFRCPFCRQTNELTHEFGRLNHNPVALEWFTKILKNSDDEDEQKNIIVGISGILKCLGIFNQIFLKKKCLKDIDRKLANLCQANTNQNQINIQSALAYNYLKQKNTACLLAGLKGISNLHYGRATEKCIEKMNKRVKNVATPQIENLMKKTVAPMCHIVLATATRLEGEWLAKFEYSEQRPFYKNSSQYIKKDYYEANLSGNFFVNLEDDTIPFDIIQIPLNISGNKLST